MKLSLSPSTRLVDLLCLQVCVHSVVHCLETIFFIVLNSYFVGIQEKESWDMNTEEKIEAAGKKKEEGNALFKAGKYTRASKRYEKVNREMRLHDLKIVSTVFFFSVSY